MARRRSLTDVLEGKLSAMPPIVEKGKGADQFFEDTTKNPEAVPEQEQPEATPKKRGRRKISDVKVVFYLLEEQYQYLMQRAEDTHQSMSAVARQIIDEERKKKPTE